MAELRVVANQIGAALEVHGQEEKPVCIGMIGRKALEEFRARLIRRCPDMKYATYGHVLELFILDIFPNLETAAGIKVSPKIWQYNASEEKYYC